jgi:1-acyl-sn-glycerol-3-phosphate acyltransferase
VTWLGQPDLPAERLWLWQIGFPPVRAIALLLAPIRVEGREDLPARGPYILVSNHISWYDPPAIEFALGLAIRYMAKAEVFKTPLIGGILHGIGNFPVRRGEADRGALETALRVLAAGQPLGFFPEGTRSRDGTLRRAKPGIGFLARRSGATLVPLAISGTPRAGFPVLPRGRIVLRVGKPFQLADLGANRDDQAVADGIMRRVAALLPSHMRGVYAEDPPLHLT